MTTRYKWKTPDGDVEILSEAMVSTIAKIREHLGHGECVAYRNLERGDERRTRIYNRRKRDGGKDHE